MTVVSGRVARPLRRTGYTVAIGVNLLMIWIVTNVVEWDVLPFLTGQFAQLVSIAVFSMIVGIALNLGYLFFDPPWFRTLGDTINSAIAFVVILRTLQVFPFEFEGGFWTGATRVVLVFLSVATAIATLANIGKLTRESVDEQDPVNRSI
jgi:hypothetical protein